MVGGGTGEESSKGKRKRNSAFLQEPAAEEPKRTRVHAQRKFAQGAGGGNPQASPLKEVRTRAKVDNGSSSSSSSSGQPFPTPTGERPKTEDFLTFLCLRGTDFLPPELDFFNQASTPQNNDESSEDSFSDQDDLNKDPEVDKNGVEKKSSKRLGKDTKTKKSLCAANLKKKDVDMKPKEGKNGVPRKTRSHSQDSLSSPERKTEPRQTRSQNDADKSSNLEEVQSSSCNLIVNDLKLESKSESNQIPSRSGELESSDESLFEHDQKGHRKKSESELDADEEASSRESSRKPISRRSVDAKHKDSLSRLKQREGRSTSRDSSGSKDSLQAAKQQKKGKDTSKFLSTNIVSDNFDLSVSEAKDDKLDNESGSDNGNKRRDSIDRLLTSSVEKEENNKTKDKKESKKEKKHKKKKNTSLKDLQNSLLAEAKRNVAEPAKTDHILVKSENFLKVPSSSPGESDTPDVDDRILVSQTGYVGVKPRQSIDQVSDEGGGDSKSPQRRNSGAYAAPVVKKLMKAGERVPTPPRKILPKGEVEPQRASASPISGRTNHLPVGVMGAAGLSNRMTAAQPVALNKPAVMVTSQPIQQRHDSDTRVSVSYSQPLVIQTSMHNPKQSVSAPSAQPTIIVPGHNTGQQGVPIQVSTMPVQMQSVPHAGGLQPVQVVGAGPHVVSTGVTGYQGVAGIPIIGPAGMQFGIPVQTANIQGIPTQLQNNTVQVRPSQATGHQAVVTVPTYIRSGYTYNQTVARTTSITTMTTTTPENIQASQHHSNLSMSSHLPQTITMPSGTTIQYNVPPSSIKQPSVLHQQTPMTKWSNVTQNINMPPSSSLSTNVISTSTSPLVSPGPPTLSPQISSSQRSKTNSGNKQLTKPDGPPVLTPPVRKQDEPKARRELNMKQLQQLPVSRTATNESPHVTVYSPQAVYSNQAQLSSPNYSRPPESVNPSAYHSQTAVGYQHPSPNYHQQSSPSSFHSPSSVHSPGYHPLVSPHGTPMGSPIHSSYQQSTFPQGYPVSPVQYQHYQTSQQQQNPQQIQVLQHHHQQTIDSQHQAQTHQTHQPNVHHSHSQQPQPATQHTQPATHHPKPATHHAQPATHHPQPNPPNPQPHIQHSQLNLQNPQPQTQQPLQLAQQAQQLAQQAQQLTQQSQHQTHHQQSHTQHHQPQTQQPNPQLQSHTQQLQPQSKHSNSHSRSPKHSQHPKQHTQQVEQSLQQSHTQQPSLIKQTSHIQQPSHTKPLPHTREQLHTKPLPQTEELSNTKDLPHNQKQPHLQQVPQYQEASQTQHQQTMHKKDKQHHVRQSVHPPQDKQEHSEQPKSQEYSQQLHSQLPHSQSENPKLKESQQPHSQRHLEKEQSSQQKKNISETAHPIQREHQKSQFSQKKDNPGNKFTTQSNHKQEIGPQIEKTKEKEKQPQEPQPSSRNPNQEKNVIEETQNNKAVQSSKLHPIMYPEKNEQQRHLQPKEGEQVKLNHEGSKESTKQLEINPEMSPQSTSQTLHSPLTHSSAHSHKKSQMLKHLEDTNKEEKSVTETQRKEVELPTHLLASTSQSEDTTSESLANSLNSKKKSSDKMLKTKLGEKTGRPIKTFDVDDESSPYAFDFDKSETPLTEPFRKSSSPLKPPTMLKKINKGSSEIPPESKEHADLQPTISRKQPINPCETITPNVQSRSDKKQELVDSDKSKNINDSEVVENPEDTSSSDNETTYFIPLQNSAGQSFGVAVKLGTDGPCGPNQKVIMTAKLITSPSNKPAKAKILGSKTIESKMAIPVNQSCSSSQNTSTPTKETPKKLRMPNASPVAPNRRNLISPIMESEQQPSLSKPRMRRAMSPDSGLSTGSNVKDTSSNSGKKRPICLLGQVNTGHRFPRLGQHAEMMEVPTFRPSESEFEDPLRYIQKIRSYAEQFGMCRIIPPKSFKPECNVSDDMRFTAYNQYINRMWSRWGPNSKETAAIKRYLDTQNVDTRAHPLVGGLEVDLPALYHAVQSFGGLTEVIQKKKWNKIAEYLRVSRGSNLTAAANKLDDIYVKWLLPYDTLSNVERDELIRLVEEEWAEASRDKDDKSKMKDNTSTEDEDDEEEDEEQEAVVKGKSTSLTAFYRLAKNLLTMVFRNDEEPSHHTVEDEYWKIVADKDVHMQVSQGSIDTGREGYGFPIRNSSFASNPWNLKNLTNNPRSILRAMGSVMGVTQPTLHVGMLFTTGCWYRDPHGLPWIEYLHSGSPKIWYGIPDDHSLAFYTAMKQLVPSFCKNRKIWLSSDTTMVSPSLLVKHGVSVCRAVQQPGQFVVVFPKSYTSSICTGYSVSESVYYAPSDWLNDVDSVFQDIKDSIEPMMFPLEKMLFSLASDSKSTKYVLELIKPKIEAIRDREIRDRREVLSHGIKASERLKLNKNAFQDQEDDEYECQVCNTNLYVSFIANEEEETTYCLRHGIEYVKASPKLARQCKLLYTQTVDEVTDILRKLEVRLEDGIYINEHEEDNPIKDDDILDFEDEDYVDEEEIKPRDRSLPSYIKKEKKPLISSESEDDDDDDNKDGENRQFIDADDYLDDFADDDIPVIEALFSEDDEVVRPSSKRRAPRVRKVSESSDEDVEETEDNSQSQITETKKESVKSSKQKKEKAVRQQPNASKPKKLNNKKLTKQNVENSKKDETSKLEQSTSESNEVQTTKDIKANSKVGENEVVSDKGKRKLEAETEAEKEEESRKKFKAKNVSVKVKNISKEELETEKSLKFKETKSGKNKEQNEPEKKDSKKNTPSKKGKDEKKTKEKKQDPTTSNKSKQRRSKKRKAKSMDAADQFNLLDIILTETDDENYCSNSEKESVETSSDEEYWK